MGSLPKTVDRIPLDRLWDDDRELHAVRDRLLSRPAITEMLRQYPVEFYVADIGQPLRRVDTRNCYEFWKSEVSAHLVDDPDSAFRLDDFPGDYAYIASQWSSEIETPIVLLEKFH